MRRTPARRSLARLGSFVSFVLAAMGCARPVHAVQVWTAIATQKLLPSAGAGATASAAISAARNEFEAFQIAVTGAASAVTASASPLTGPGTIPAPRLFREALIGLRYASAPDGWTGPTPDALVPDVDEFAGEARNAFPFDVPPGETRAIWARVFVPPDAAPGDYHGTVTVAWAGGSASVPVSLHVWPFRLPSTPSLKSAFGFSYGAIPAGHGLPEGDAFATLRDRYGRMALDHRISLSHFDDGPRVFEHMSTSYAGQVTGTAPTTLAGARLTSVQSIGPASATQWAALAQGGGWMDRLFDYVCDEPPMTCAWSDIPARAAADKAVDPSYRTLVTTSIQDATRNGVTSAIDIMVPVINDLDDKPGRGNAGEQRAKYDAFLASGPLKEVWTYQSCMSHGCGDPAVDYDTGWPSYMIDASAIRSRAQEWLSFRYRLTGELYYETTQAYSHDAWTSQWDFTGNGDGTLFYPGTPARIGGTTHVPVESLRLEMIREGMEDFEYLKLLSDAGDPDLAQQLAAQLFPNAYTTDADPQALMAARARIAERIVALGAAGAVAPLPAGGGSEGSGSSGSGAGGGEPATGTQPLPGTGCASGGATAGLAVVVPALLLALRRRRGARRPAAGGGPRRASRARPSATRGRRPRARW